MNVIYIEATYPKKIVLPERLLTILPDKIALFTTVQFVQQLDSMKQQLEHAGKQVVVFKTRNTRYAGQLYGCNIDEFKGAFDAFLYVGDGLFHPKALLLKNDKPVFVYDPKTEKSQQLNHALVEKLRKQQKGAMLKFLSSKHVGVLVSTKPGQNFYRKSLKLKEKYPDKQFYYIAANTIDFASLEDFPFIECFVNTACPRIGYDDTNKFEKPVVNLFDLIER